MREHTKIWVAVYAAGVMAGILYANLIAQESIMQMGIFAENHLTESVKCAYLDWNIYGTLCVCACYLFAFLRLQGQQDGKRQVRYCFFYGQVFWQAYCSAQQSYNLE